MQRLSIIKGNAFVLIYSVSSKQSLEELAPIIRMLQELKGDAISKDEVPIMLVGNKKDDPKREVSTETGEKLSSRWGTGFIETSAKNNENITELFQQLLAREKKRTLTLNAADADGKDASKKKCLLMWTWEEQLDIQYLYSTPCAFSIYSLLDFVLKNQD